MTDAPTVERISALVATIASITPPGAEQDIYDAGFASVDALTLLVELEEQFGVTIPDDRFVLCRTPDAFAAMITDLRGVTS